MYVPWLKDKLLFCNQETDCFVVFFAKRVGCVVLDERPLPLMDMNMSYTTSPNVCKGKVLLNHNVVMTLLVKPTCVMHCASEHVYTYMYNAYMYISNCLMLYINVMSFVSVCTTIW